MENQQFIFTYKTFHTEQRKSLYFGIELSFGSLTQNCQYSVDKFTFSPLECVLVALIYLLPGVSLWSHTVLSYPSKIYKIASGHNFLSCVFILIIYQEYQIRFYLHIQILSCRFCIFKYVIRLIQSADIWFQKYFIKSIPMYLNTFNYCIFSFNSAYSVDSIEQL